MTPEAEPISRSNAPYGVAALAGAGVAAGLAAPAGEAQARVDQAAAEAVLWERHLRGKDARAREELVLLYLPYARTVAAMLYRRHVNHEADFRDYVQWATLGLIEALDRYDDQRGIKFSTYAHTRLLGAIRNGLEHISERQEQISLHRRLVAERVESLRRARELTALAESGAELLGEMAEISTTLILSFMLDDTNLLQGPADALPDGCYEAVAYKQEQRRLRESLQHLTPREQSVIRMHYLQGMTYDDVAATLRITKGRVSQLHQQALERLRRLFSRTSPP